MIPWPSFSMLPLGASRLHTSERPSTTAQWVTLGRVLELERPPESRIVSDEYAPAFLTGSARRLLRPARTAFALTRRVERTDLASIMVSAICRHRFIDDHLLQAVPDVEQVLILGAGYDSRAYRFADELEQRPVFEVDLPPLSRQKAAVVASRPDLFGHASIERVEIDFRTQSLTEQLEAAGFRRGAPTFVVWEGVSMYLVRDAVVDTLSALGEVCGSGSVLAMDAWRRVAGNDAYTQLRRLGERGVGMIGEPIEFRVQPGDLAVLLADAGFTVIDVATATQMTSRFATDGRHCDQGMYVTAARLN